MFEDRKDAGKKLGKALARYKDSDALVLAIPRGGVEVGYYVAEKLGSPLSIIVVRKLPFPDNPEAGFGALAEDGSAFFIDRFCNRVSSNVTEGIIEEQKKELERRVEVSRKGKSLPEINGKRVILVDDGIAMGSTIRAAVKLCKNKKAGEIIVAAPVASPETVEEIGRTVDEVIVLEQPVFFGAVAQAYKKWYDVPDDEVIRIMESTGFYEES